MRTILGLRRMVRAGPNFDRFADRLVERIRIGAPGLHRYLDGLCVHLEQQAFYSTFWAEQQLRKVDLGRPWGGTAVPLRPVDRAKVQFAARRPRCPMRS